MTEDRDLKMGRALASIPLPELSEGFYSRLGERLEHARPAARPARRGPRALRFGIVAAVVAAAAAVVAFAVLPALRGGPETATAAEMLASMNAAAGNAQVVRLDILEQRSPLVASASPSSSPATARSPRPRTVTEQLTLSSAGDVRYSSVRELLDAMGTRVQMQTLETYDARRHEMMRHGETHPVEGQPLPDPNPYDQPMPRTVLVNRPSWGTTVFSTYLLANFQALSNSLRALLAESDPATPVEVATYLGRPAWHTTLSEVMPSAEGSAIPVAWSVTVDKETGLLVASELKATSGDELPRGLARSFHATRIEVDPDLPSGWQRIDTSDVDEIAIFDLGTRFGTPQTVAVRAWPTLVLVPKDVPQGYRLTAVATRDYEGMEKTPGDHDRYIVLQRRDPRIYASERTEIDASKQRVQLRYRRGFSSFVVSIRPLAGGEVSGSSAASCLSGAEDVVLSGGYLKGAKARVWISPYFGEGPTLVTFSDRSRITITGDLTRQELLDIADSFMAVGDGDKPLPEGYGK
jgi:hypothetical protein